MQITTHRLADGPEVRFVAGFAPRAERLVRSCRPGPMPSARIVLTTPDGIQELGIASMAGAAGAPRHTWQNAGALTGHDGQAPYACTVLAPHGVDILIAVQEAEEEGLEAVLLHEVVHALQLAPPRARAAELRFLRHAFGLQPMTERALRRAQHRLDIDESEACRIEGHLLRRI